MTSRNTRATRASYKTMRERVSERTAEGTRRDETHMPELRHQRLRRLVVMGESIRSESLSARSHLEATVLDGESETTVLGREPR